ncbi:ATP-binding protein [Pediococcus pentosaceus]|uniref:ATP-binding protein n=1 Tax=Pediococcus pentosaceus TaxID=1255 RepID=UPI00207422D2|nr:ATP-binding protein [Pediococcus pentosaceus]MCM6809235.1 ATP-binding protein [Pediococcus pentosaceus]
MIKTKKLGVIVAVDGTISTVGMYNMSNDPDLIWNGDILIGPKVGAYLTIRQNDAQIIASVITEKVIDQQNTIKSKEFDNRYSKNSINRVIQLKTQGVITNGKFEITSSCVPMIGNEVTLTTQKELEMIYGVSEDDICNENTIEIGKSVLEKQPIRLPINNFFASHIGIFGNTESGKSNTLHKLYLELVKSKYKTGILNKSQFLIIDFNGEYTQKDAFGLSKKDKRVFNINTRKPQDKITVTRDYLFDPDILSVLFDAKPATQVPFLRNALRIFNENVQSGESFADLEIGLMKSILSGMKQVASDAKDNWIQAGKNLDIESSLFVTLENLTPNKYYNALFISDQVYISAGGVPSNNFMEKSGLNKIKAELIEKFNAATNIKQLEFFLEFQKVYVSAWKSTNLDFINPLFNRIKSAFNSLEKVIEIKDDLDGVYKSVNVFNLVNANQEITRLIPMLISKMFYDQQKSTIADSEVTQTKHLIIDEAHNILNAEHRNVGDSWQDYRLSIFEEIIKEGRKFGFFLTLCSQRPADISATILSQVHNYLIHRLVNDKDLKMLENTMPTLDRRSLQMIPSLGKGEAVVTGNAIQVPVFIKVDPTIIRPKSDDVVLTDIWTKKN